MANKIDKEFDLELKRQIVALSEGIDKSLDFMKKKIEDLTPEDTKELVWNYEIENATLKWNIISWKVYNNTDYAYWVEYWVAGRIFKYNKPKWIIFTIWIWARMMTKAGEKNRDNIQNIIKESLWNK